MRRLFIGFAAIAFVLFVFAFVNAQVSVSSFSPIYKNVTKNIQVTKTVLEDVQYSCYDGISKNITCTKKVPVEVFDHIETITISSEIIGFTTEKGSVFGYGFKNSLYDYPIGNRNLVEYGKCRQYEIDKGVCEDMK